MAEASNGPAAAPTWWTLSARRGLVLGIDTSVDVQAGVAADGTVLGRASHDDRRAHAERLMPVVTELLQQTGTSMADLDEVVVGLGPGPFTGLRVGIASAQMLALANRIDWVGVCGLDVLAAQFLLGDRDDAGRPYPGEFVVAIDARRKELYWARFSVVGERIGPPEVSAAAALPDLPVTGPGVGVYTDVLGDRVRAGPQTVDAAVLAAWCFPAVGTEPLYLRRPDATVATRHKSALPRVLPRRAGDR